MLRLHTTQASKQENTSQVKQQISDELFQNNNYHTNIRKRRQLKTGQLQQIKMPNAGIIEAKGRGWKLNKEVRK